MKVKAATFTDTVSQTAHLAEVISDKVRQLDKEQTRAKLAIKYVEDVQELKFCISSLNEAMQKKEYDRAALLLQRASKIDSSILKGSLAEFTVVRHHLYLHAFAYILPSLHQSTQIIQKEHWQRPKQHYLIYSAVDLMMQWQKGIKQTLHVTSNYFLSLTVKQKDWISIHDSFVTLLNHVVQMK